MCIKKTRSVYLGFNSKTEKDKFLKQMKLVLGNTPYIKDWGYFLKKKGSLVYEVEIELENFEQVQVLESAIRASYQFKTRRVWFTYVCNKNNEEKTIKKLLQWK